MRALLVFFAVFLAVHADPAITKCDNGGSLKATEVDDKGVVTANECICQSYWEGDTCETIVCVNGGYAIPEVPAGAERQACHCPRGYYGIHCDAVKQARPVDGVFNTDKSFNLYIHNELTDWYGTKALKRIEDQIPKIVKDYSTSFNSYNLFVSERGESVDVKHFESKQQSDFFDAVKALGDGKRTTTYTCKPSSISYAQILKNLKAQKIEDSVMLMFTQYPPDDTVYPDDSEDSVPIDLAKLKEYLRAFRVKLNVLIGADDILLDCNSKKNGKGAKFNDLTDLVHFSDGEIASFLIEEDNSPDELLPSFIKASASPQSHSRAASTSCEIGLEFEFQTDPYPNTYFIAVRTDQNDDPTLISGSCSSGGEVTAVAVSDYNEFTLSSILSGAQQTCKLTVTAKGACLATVYSVGGEKDVDKFDIFHSFATSDDMDTDSIHSFKNEENFLTMHIDISSDSNEEPKYQIVEFGGSVFVKNEQKKQEVSDVNLLKRSPATFDYQSVATFACPEDGKSWVQLNLEGFNVNGESVAKLNRIIHLNCEERKSPAVDPPKLLRMMDEGEVSTKPATSIVLMYSNGMPTNQFSRFILEGVRPDVIEQKFTQYGYLRFEGQQVMDYKPTTNFGDFRRDVYDFAPDKDLGYQNNLKQHLQKLTGTSEEIKSDSLVSIAICRPMTDPDVSKNWASNLAELSNLGAKLLFWGDVNTVKIGQESDSLKVYTRYAAISAGHVVLMDMDDFPDDDDSGDYYVSLALRDLYSFGPSQRLLSYANLEWDAASTTSQSSPIGTLQIPTDTTEVFVSITLNVENPNDVAPAFMLTIVLEGAADRIVLDLGAGDFTQYGSPGFVRSNLYTTNFTVVGGESYDGTFTLLAMSPTVGAHIRFWTARVEGETIPKLDYVGFDQKSARPDDYIGAALRVPDSDGKTMSLRFLDNKGIEATRLDHNQTVDVQKGVAHFIPFFCNSNQSKSDSFYDMYTIEVTYDSGFKYFRPLLCSKGSPANAACVPQGPAGDSFCTESNPPFHRGPSKMLIDCSGEAGQVVWSDEVIPDYVVYNYKCQCGEGFAGPSCEQSSCAAGIQHLPQEDDASFRTLSYVLVSPAGEEGCTSLSAFYAEDAKKLFDSTQTYENIWQYTFSVYFTDGTAKTLYRGPSFAEFNGVFDSFQKEDFDVPNFCGNAKNTTTIDLNTVYNLAVESVGRNSRGIVLLYAIQSFFDQDIENELNVDNVVASNELYQSIQAYQQHIYMVTPTVLPDLIAMTTASGGTVVKMLSDYVNYNNDVQRYQKMLDGVLRSQIGWAGVATEAVSRTSAAKTSWLIKQKSDVFVTYRTAEGGTVPVVTGVTLENFPYDEDDDDKSISYHAYVDDASDTNPVTVEITFDADKKTDLVQVVILTRENPIHNALLGQGQVNTDKHAAGATNTSEKAVHISFDRASSEMYFQPASDNWRQASRINCSFAQEFVAFTQPFTDIGASVVDFMVSKMIPDGAGTGGLIPDPSSNFTIAIPLAVSMEIDCVHGKFFEEGSYCKCDTADWSGPTCAQPACEEPGRLNSHGDHCDCSEAQFGGLFCRDPTVPVGMEESEP